MKALSSEYSLQGPIFELSTNWSMTKDDGPRNENAANELGIRLVSTNEKYVIQARTHGFTISRLEPYESWGDLVVEARRLWEVYKTHVQLDSIVRVASRFINRLKLPMRAEEQFEQYLSTPPGVPGDLPQGVLGFMQRVVIFEPKHDLRANVIQLLQEGSAPRDHVPVILDIDVYKRVDLLPDAPDAWAILEEIRAFKNAIFFAALTERTVELFE